MSVCTKYIFMWLAICLDLISIIWTFFSIGVKIEINFQKLFMFFIFSSIISVFLLLCFKKIGIDYFISVIKYITLFMFFIITFLLDNYADSLNIARGSALYHHMALPAILPFSSAIILSIINR